MKAVPAALVMAVIVTLAACSMKQNIALNADGSGSAVVRVTLGPLVTQYLSDILDGLVTGPEKAGSGPPLFDLPRIRKAFADLPGVTVNELKAPARNSLLLHLTFADVNALIPPPAGTATAGSSTTASERPIEFHTHAGVSTLTVHLSRRSWSAVAGLPALANDPLLATLGPQGGAGYSESEYLNMLEYAFADYASKEEVRQELDSSALTIRVTVSGTIVAQSGGSRAGSSVVYRIPLVRVATLTSPIDLSLSFRS